MNATPPPSLYKAQEPIFPRQVTGFFRKFKWWIMAVTLGIYYLTPWIRWDRGVNLPDQAVLIDMATATSISSGSKSGATNSISSQGC